MATYSFKSIFGAIAGPGGFAQIGAGAGADEEGITIEPAEDKNMMQVGADGEGQHSLIASDAAKVTIRLLKTSPVNAILMAMYDLQSATPALWGQNVITFTDSARGDIHALQACAFNKKPTINYKKEAGMNEWIFDSLKASSILGLG